MAGAEELKSNIVITGFVQKVTIDPAVAGRARLAVERMLAVGRGRGG